jgi:DNA-directed RNA polymerase specialized sigma24 family protein
VITPEALACELQTLQCKAREGARAASARRQVVEDAVLKVVELWENRATGGGFPIHDLAGWAYRVGRNAARRLGRAAGRTPPTSAPRACEPEVRDAHADEHADGVRATLAAALAAGHMTERQRAVVSKVLEPGMTLHRAAKELEMDRSHLRRTLRRAARTLARDAAPALVD